MLSELIFPVCSVAVCLKKFLRIHIYGHNKRYDKVQDKTIGQKDEKVTNPLDK
jgi:hypothetical protein